MNLTSKEEHRGTRKPRHARLFLFLEIATVALAVGLYLGVFRPREKRDADWQHKISRGQAAFDQSHFAEARQEFLSSLEFAEKRGMGEIAVATSQARVADADRGLEKYDEAIRLDETARPIFQKYQSRWKKDYPFFLVKLGATYQQVGRYGEAESLYSQALVLQEKTLGPKDLALTDTLNAMAYFYYDRDQNEKAVPLMERSLAICQANLAPKDPRTAWALSMMSLIYDGKGTFSEAERMAREALPILETARGPNSFEVAWLC